MLVYLAGPITGLSFNDTTDWRNQAISYLNQFGITGLSPLRGKDYLRNEKSIADTYDEKLSGLAGVMSGQRGIYARDKFDCHRADIVIANFLGATKVSIGTVMEVAWAAQNNTPVILIMEPSGNPHDHCMLREAASFRVDNLRDALTLVAIMEK